MGNNEKIEKIISDLQELISLTSSMKGSDLYPVSFFSNTFDLIQKIQNEFHKIEVHQVEMFASQMKKHQTMILSIHQQMKYIDASSVSIDVDIPKTVFKPVADVEPVSIEPPVSIVREEDINEDVPAPGEKEVIDIENKIDEDKKIVMKSDVQDEPAKKSSLFGVFKKKEFPKELSNEDTDGSVKDLKEEAAVEKNIEEDAGKKEDDKLLKGRSTVTMPVTPKKVSIINEATSVAKENSSNTNDKFASKESNLSINDAINKGKLYDLNKALSINDRFRYRRELFGGKEDLMNKVIKVLNNMDSYDVSLAFLQEKLHWDLENPTVKDFVKKLELKYSK